MVNECHAEVTNGSAPQSEEPVRSRPRAQTMRFLQLPGLLTSQRLMPEEVASVKSRVSIPRPLAHNLPPAVMWGVTLTIAASVALANFAIVWPTLLLMEWKFVAMQLAVDRAGVAAGILALAGASAVLAALCAVLVCKLAPACAGGGLPEMKGYLNGNGMPGLFSLRNLAVRSLGIILSPAAGFPIGREGPTISIGCHVGYEVVQMLASPHMRLWVNVDVKSSGAIPALMIDEERLMHVKRLGCALGGACGMAAIFNAPIGGILYMLEEVTATSWVPVLTFRAFVGTGICVMVNSVLLNATGQRVQDFLIYVTGPQSAEWSWADVPFFVLLGVLAGAYSAAYTRLLAWAFRARQRLARGLQRWQPWAKVAECTLHAVACAVVFGTACLAVDCQPGAGAGLDSAVRFNCPEGTYNPAASLLLTGPEESIKQLYTRTTPGELQLDALAVAIAAYTVMNVGMMGLAVPMGSFIPAMFTGGLLGRAFGRVFFDLQLGLAQDGIYALMGSAAMLGAFTHQTLAIVVFLIECVNNLHLITPMMVTIFVSHAVTKRINCHSLDEWLIEMKRIPFLDAEVPEAMDRAGVHAADLCEPLPSSALLLPEASASDVQRALAQSRAPVFPILRDGTCIGLATRSRLRAALRACAIEVAQESLRQNGSESLKRIQLWDRVSGELEDEEADIDFLVARLCGQGAAPVSPTLADGAKLPLFRLMDPSPYTVLENMPAPRLYPLFTRLGIHAACVVSCDGDFHGIITRGSLIASAQREASHSDHCSPRPAGGDGLPGTDPAGATADGAESQASGGQDGSGWEQQGAEAIGDIVEV